MHTLLFNLPIKFAVMLCHVSCILYCNCFEDDLCQFYAIELHFDFSIQIVSTHDNFVAFAINNTQDSDTLIVKHATVTKQEYAIKLGLQGGPDGVEIPLKSSAAGVCRQTLRQYYTPRTKESSFLGEQITHRTGLNTQLTTPIMVNGDKFVGCIVTCMEQEDGFSEIDRMLVNNVAHMLGASIYSKRLRLAAESSNKVSREMLHSLIPPQVRR